MKKQIKYKQNKKKIIFFILQKKFKKKIFY